MYLTRVPASATISRPPPHTHATHLKAYFLIYLIRLYERSIELLKPYPLTLNRDGYLQEAAQQNAHFSAFLCHALPSSGDRGDARGA
eukprot:scaffold50346_cov55-Phaeocystis_antarctica.AAC.4